MIRRPPRSTQSRSSAASDVYKRQVLRWPLDLARCTLGTRRCAGASAPPTCYSWPLARQPAPGSPTAAGRPKNCCAICGPKVNSLDACSHEPLDSAQNAVLSEKTNMRLPFLSTPFTNPQHGAALVMFGGMWLLMLVLALAEPAGGTNGAGTALALSLIHISEPTRPY